jgi:hypothetical protein
MKTLWILALCCGLQAQDWRPLFNGKNLDGWEIRGDSIWTVLKDGTLVGQRPYPRGKEFGGWPVTRERYEQWAEPQSLLYTTEEFERFDLHVEHWIPPGGNIGVSIRDKSRARYALPGAEHDAARTPSHIGYEIQIDAGTDPYPSGSIYNFVKAPKDVQHKDDWNSLDIESRHEMIRVRLNGEPVSESAGDPARSKAGPIGLQLHDRFSWAMFRNIRIREIR